MNERKPPRLRVGREFESSEVKSDIIKAKASYLEVKTKSAIAIVVVICCVIALGVALWSSIPTGDFDPVKNVWMIAGPTLSVVIYSYFGKRNASGENNDESSA